MPKSSVDESLFGGSSGRGPRGPGGAISRSQLEKVNGSIARDMSGGLVISRGELSKIKAMGVIETYSDKQKRAAAVREAREQKMKKAQLRKKRMIEKEKEAKKHRVKSDIEIIKEAEANALLSAAGKQMEENEDAVKEMNRMVLYAQCVAVRDKQLEDKRIRAEKAKEENRLLDLRAEIARLKALQKEENIRAEKRARMKEDAKIIIAQKAAKEKRKMLEREALELEGKQMLKQIAARREQEKADAIRKRAEGKVLLNQVLEANEAAIKARGDAKLFEIEENERIQEYMREQERKAKKREEEEAERKRRIEEDTIRVRNAQAKAQDSQAENDARRALRHQQEQEKKERQQVRDEMEKRKKELALLMRAREEQVRVKAIANAEEAARQKRDHKRVIAEQKMQMAREKVIEDAKKKEAASHVKELRNQMLYNEELLSKNKGARMAEAERIRQEKVTKLHKLEKIRKEKIELLKATGVPKKYWSELESMKITIA